MPRCRHENGEFKAFRDLMVTRDVGGGRLGPEQEYEGEDALWAFDCTDCDRTIRYKPDRAPQWLRKYAEG